MHATWKTVASLRGLKLGNSRSWALRGGWHRSPTKEGSLKCATKWSKIDVRRKIVLGDDGFISVCLEMGLNMMDHGHMIIIITITITTTATTTIKSSFFTHFMAPSCRKLLFVFTKKPEGWLDLQTKKKLPTMDFLINRPGTKSPFLSNQHWPNNINRSTGGAWGSCVVREKLRDPSSGICLVPWRVPKNRRCLVLSKRNVWPKKNNFSRKGHF